MSDKYGWQNGKLLTNQNDMFETYAAKWKPENAELQKTESSRVLY